MNIFKSLKTSFIITLLFIISPVIFTGCSNPHGDKTAAVSTPRMTVDPDALAREIERDRQTMKVPGVAVAVVKDGKVLLSRGFGVKRHGHTDKVDTGTLFAIASNSKAFTAASLAILKDEGKIDWDDKVTAYLPYFQLYDPYVTREMTIRDLLCHRSGLKTFSGDLLWYETAYDAPEIIKRARHLKPDFGFRDGYGYSNIMFAAAGEVVASVTGKSWNRFAAERFFMPLQMKNTCIGIPELKKNGNYATPHFIDLDGNVIEVPYSKSGHIGAAAGINSNVEDMANWLIMLLEKGKFNGKQVLSEDRLRELWSSQNIIPISAASAKWIPAIHFKTYGLGWGLFDYHGYKIVSHSGALDGMISRVALVPEKKLGFVILTNSINSLPSVLLYKILDRYLGLPSTDWTKKIKEFGEKRYAKQLKKRDEIKADLAKPRPPLDKKRLESYTGIYTCTLYGDMSVRLESGKLVLNFLPTPVFVSDLIHKENDTFFIQLRNKFSFIPTGMGTVRFSKDKNNNVTGVTVDIPNGDFHFTELDFKKRKENK